MNIPTIRGGLNGSIADILEASGYGTETAFTVDDDIKYVLGLGFYIFSSLICFQFLRAFFRILIILSIFKIHSI